MDQDYVRRVFSSYATQQQQQQHHQRREEDAVPQQPLMPLAELRFALTAALGVRLKAREIRSYILRAPGEFQDGVNLEQFIWIVDSIATNSGCISEMTYYQVLDPRHRGLVSAEGFQDIFASVAPRMFHRCGLDIFSTLDESGCGKLNRPRLLAILKENLQ